MTMAPQITTRRATVDDLPVLREFQQGIVQAERPFDPTLADGELYYHDLSGLISRSDTHLIIAVVNEQVAGCAFGQLREAEHFLRHRQYCYVGMVFVLPAFRGIGVPSKLLETLRSWSLAHNITEMRLQVYQDNERAIRAYEKEGFAKHMLVMRRDLSSDR